MAEPVRIPTSNLEVSNPNSQETLRLLLLCMEERFTGSFEVHFQNGIPQVYHRTTTGRFGDHLTRRG